MVTAARDRLARTLRGDTETAFSAELTLRAENLNLTVEGFGLVRFPVTPAKARELARLGQPAQGPCAWRRRLRRSGHWLRGTAPRPARTPAARA